jgi:hypothetical protein
VKAVFVALVLLATAAHAGGYNPKKPKTGRDGTPIGDRPVLVVIEYGPRIDHPKPSPKKGDVVPMDRALVIEISALTWTID